MALGVRAPELEPNLGWLNTDRPLRIAHELRGQVVVLDFWTYCCINCIHILPDLAFLEEKYEHEPVTFVGVHSAKFSNEASTETIRAAMLRYEIKHPVVVDDRMKLWRQFTVRSWPTVVVIDSAGYVVGTLAGEGNREKLDALIAQALEHGRASRTLAAGPLEIQRDAMVQAASGLAFPGKVLADSVSKRLFVADSNHNRIIIAELPDTSGRSRVLQVVGRGQVGREDGLAQRAAFNHPQGLATGQGKLYVADTENHSIRSIDLSTYHVSTVCGTGEMCNDRAGGGMGVDQGLNSPWDLTIEGSTLYVAMAGVHQIWRIDLPVGFARALAGSGRENLVDGPTETSALAQPSGICTLNGNIYFADSEVSAIRGIDMATEQVFTVIGEGLFTFGDVDGVHPQAKLQHPLGVAPYKASLIVADTYNHKIKQCDPGSRSVRTLFGNSKPGTRADNGQPLFFEPGGISVCGDDLFIADTNNHRIVRINLITGVWCEVIFEGLDSSVPDDDREIIKLGDAKVSDGDVELILDVSLPTHAHMNGEAPWSARVLADDRTLAQITEKGTTLPLKMTVPAVKLASSERWRVSLAFAYCTTGETALCIPVHLDWELTVHNHGTEKCIRLPATIM